MVGIISNIAALAAQSNLNTAASQSQSSIYRLSSGNSIAQASDNVAGLAIGTILKTNVSTLKTALTNTAQAESLLGVADGALANIGDILQRQKALSTQAISGSLSTQARSFLNQEFQSLKSEIDRISSTTNFNGIHLIDGSLYGPNTMQTYTRNNATYATGQLLQTVAFAAAGTLVVTNPAGSTVTFTYDTGANVAAAISTNTDRAPLYINYTANATIANQVAALYNNIQDILNYAGTDTTMMAAKSVLSEMNYATDNATYVNMTSLSAGSAGNNFKVTSSAADFKVNGTIIVAATATSITANGTAAINGDLNSGTFGTTTAFTGTATTIATGSVGDSILASINTTTQANTGVDASLISNNPGFTGTIQGFTSVYEGPNQVTAQITVGGIQYVAQSINANNSSGQRVTFASVGGTGGSFTVKVAANVAVSNQNDANTFATRLNQAFSTVLFEQNRIMSNFTAAGAVYGTLGGAATGDLAGSQINFINSNFNNVQVQNVTVTAPVFGGTIAKISVQINGETYVSGYVKDGSVATAGLDGGTSGTVIAAGNTIGLVSTTNPNHIIQFKYGGGAATPLDISTVANAQACQVALANAFGINSGATNISFQVGTTASDAIGVQIQSASSNSIYLDSSGISQATTIAVDTLSNALTASSILDNAINNVTAIRATVGALESRFNYAANNLNTSIQNQDSARSTFLDTDIAAESTNFAQIQVRLLASISVLAQANQLPQSLLKLIE